MTINVENVSQWKYWEIRITHDNGWYCCFLQTSFLCGMLGRRSLCSAARAVRRDRISLSNLMFHGYHGNLPEERILGQKFEVGA